MITSGQTYEMTFSISQEQVEAFARITGDNNPIHLDKEYAANTIFKKRIIHGFLAGSIFSRVFGTIFPGEGTIYLKQSLNFKAPMYVDQPYRAYFEVREIIEEKNRAIVITTLFDKNNKETISGEALIQNNTITKN